MTTWDMRLVCDEVAVLWDQAPNLWDLMSAPGSVRTELNYRTPSWCWNVGQWEKIPHTW